MVTLAAVAIVFAYAVLNAWALYLGGVFASDHLPGGGALPNRVLLVIAATAMLMHIVAVSVGAALVVGAIRRWLGVPASYRDVGELIGFSHVPLLASAAISLVIIVKLSRAVVSAGLSPTEASRTTIVTSAPVLAGASSILAYALAAAVVAVLVHRRYRCTLGEGLLLGVGPLLALGSLLAIANVAVAVIMGGAD